MTRKGNRRPPVTDILIRCHDGNGRAVIIVACPHCHRDHCVPRAAIAECPTTGYLMRPIRRGKSTPPPRLDARIRALIPRGRGAA